MKYFLLTLCFPFLLSAQEEKLTSELNGVEITYSYSDGSRYHVKYTPKGVMYQYLSGEGPNDWWGPFPYKAFKTKNGEFFLGWYEKGFGDQITHLVNLENKTLYGSGIIVKDKKVIEHFQAAKIEKIVRSEK
jgi:hypothetical protein